VIDDADASAADAAADEEDFFSSWDKPAIKKPTPPVSRTATPSLIGRTSSPLAAGANGKDIARTASPLSRSESSETKPVASRITHSAALRKTVGAAGPRKANVLGAKKATKLGVKKVAADVIDFDEAEKKAKEEAERIEKLGYDPDAEEAEAEAASKQKGKAEAPTILSPTPVSPTRGGFGATSTSAKSSADVERLGMGVARLGFGMVGAPKAAAQKKAGGGFGSVGPIKASSQGMYFWTLATTCN
jgi:ADP-ribosylation factor GTPase-activating protein 2/3